jgi:hypothetical protein
MPDARDYDARLKRLREHRVFRERDLSLAFLRKQFKREVERPYKQLAEIIDLWQTLVPDELRRHTRLDGLSRGVLRVSVDSSAVLYELDRLLRTGLQRQLVTQSKGHPIRRVQLRVDQIDPAGQNDECRSQNDEKMSNDEA